MTRLSDGFLITSIGLVKLSAPWPAAMARSYDEFGAVLRQPPCGRPVPHRRGCPLLRNARTIAWAIGPRR